MVGFLRRLKNLVFLTPAAAAAYGFGSFCGTVFAVSFV
jgi:hypothetical protein